MLSVRTEVLCAVTNIDATPGYYLVQVGFKFHGSCGQARFIGGFEFDDNGWMKRRVPIGSQLVKQQIIIRRILQPVRIIFGTKGTS